MDSAITSIYYNNKWKDTIVNYSTKIFVVLNCSKVRRINKGGMFTLHIG